MLRIHWKYILILLGLAVAGLIVTPYWLVDDAYISYRYAANWAEHGQLNWNLDQAPVEGYTGIFLVALAALLQKTGLNFIFLIQGLSALAMAATSVLLFLTLLREGVRKEIAFATGFAFLLSPLVYVHAYSGLETSFYVLFLTGITSFLLKLAKGKPSRSQFLLGAACLTGLVLVRPEGILYLTIALTSWAFIFKKSKNNASIQSFLIICILGVVIALFYGLFKYFQYASFFPNTYYAKKFLGFLNPESGWEILRFGGYYLALPGLIGLYFWFRGRGKQKPRPFKFLLGAFLVFSVVVCFAYFRSYLFMNYGHRFFFPFWPLFLLLLGLVVERGWERSSNHSFSAPVKLFLGIVLLGHLAIMGFRYSKERTYLLDYRSVMEEEWKPAADFLTHSLPLGSSLICYQDAGRIPFETGFVTYDFGRLNDTYLARNQPKPEEVADYFFSLNVDALVMTSWSTEKFSYWDEGMYIHNDPRMQGYELAKVFDNSRGYPYSQWVYLKRNDSDQ